MGFYDPAWQVAFERDANVWVARADGRSAHVLVHQAAWPAWSSDGSKLSVVRKDGVWVLLADGSRLHRVWRGKASAVSWHPSGRWLAISATTIRGEAIFDLDLRTGKGMPIPGMTAWDHLSGFQFGGNSAAEWSPSGRYLGYTRNGDVWIGRRDDETLGSPLGPVVWDVYRLAALANDYGTNSEHGHAYGVHRLSWSNDERHLAYSLEGTNGGRLLFVGVLYLRPGGPDVMEPLALDAHHRLTGGDGFDRDPAFLPDGRTLSVASDPAHDVDDRRIVIAENGRRRTLPFEAYHPAWRPVPALLRRRKSSV